MHAKQTEIAWRCFLDKRHTFIFICVLNENLR